MKMSSKSLKIILTATFALALVSLSGCGVFGPAPEPTMAPATVMAYAVQTISANMTQQAKDNPSPTPTLAPTATPVPPTATPLPPTATVQLKTSTPAVTATEFIAGPGAKFLYAATFPESKSEYTPNEKFGLAIGFKNIGTVAWGPGYILKMVSFTGEYTAWPELALGHVVNPGEKAEFDLAGFGSEQLGKHSWVYQLYTENGTAVTGGRAYFTYTSK
jgi:hypothetical protein